MIMKANSMSPKYYVKYIMLWSMVNKSTEMTAFQFKQSTVFNIKFLVGEFGNKNCQLLADLVTSLAGCQNRSIELSFHNSKK